MALLRYSAARLHSPSVDWISRRVAFSPLIRATDAQLPERVLFPVA